MSGSSACIGDCRDLGRVTAADLVLMTDIAVGNRAVAECSAGGIGDDDRITQEDIAQAVRSIFGGCAEGPSDMARWPAKATRSPIRPASSA